MPVNLARPDPAALFPVSGVALGAVAANIRKPGRLDLLVIRLKEGARVAGVFTQNRFCAAPVILARRHLAAFETGSSVGALVVNTGYANAGTGPQGMAAALQVCGALGGLLGCAPEYTLPFSTGVIMEPLPVDRIVSALPACIAALNERNWLPAAEAIMTTDTQPKAASRRIRIGKAEIAITGIAKGAGMIHPNMATMLGFIATEARMSPALARAMVRHAAERSFNCISVDGDTSTNDAFMLIASATADMPELTDENHAGYLALREAVTEVATQLAQAIVRDAEGATKFITLTVEQGRDQEECRRVAHAIARSPLVKTAFFASDPNLGRIVAAVGNAGIGDLDVGKVDLYLDEVLVVHDGSRHEGYRESEGQRVMKQSEIAVRVVLHRGGAGATVWSCDLSHDYVSINADYRS